MRIADQGSHGIQAGAGTRPPPPGPARGPALFAVRDLGELPVAPAPPLAVFDLTAAEQLLLWSARRWRHGRFRWAEVEAEFRRLLGSGWADALMPWDMALDLLHRFPLGQPEIRNGCATALSADEQALIRLVALAQCPAGATADFLLHRLAPAQGRAELAEWLALVAAALPPLALRC